MLRVRVLGPLDAGIDGAPIRLGRPRQRAVLALLLTGRGHIVSVDRIIDQLWRGQASDKAVASLHVYVSNLRRLLEPGRPPRGPAGVLVRRPPGYALHLPDDAVDAWRFEAAVRRAGDAPPGEARRLLEEALGWWRGPAYAEWADERWAGAEVARLGELRLVARELAIAATLGTGRPGPAVPAAEALAREEPLREEAWRLLALALWACGRRADALAALRRAAAVLADELGLDPGPALTDLKQAVLTQRLEVLRAAVPGPAPVIVGARASARPDTVPAVPAVPSGSPDRPAAPPEGAEELFVGRAAELRTLDAAARAARHGGGVVLVTGEAGAGKSALLGQFGRRLRAEGWTVAVGRCPESDGAPPAWAWVEALTELARTAPPSDPGPLAPLLADPQGRPPRDDDAGAGRFRLHRAFGSWLRAAAAGAPLAVIIDDLHRADGETMALLARAADLAGAPVLTVAAYRPADAEADAEGRLTETLAELARRSPHRLALDGLPPGDVGTLVGAVCGAPVDAGTVAALAERTGGNPFYVRESARLLACEGALVATSEVPQGVRDVLRRRLRQLSPGALALLQLASVVGRESEVGVLVDAAGADEQEVLDGLEAGVVAGLLTEPGPGRIRFAHALVRDTLYTDLVGVRRGRLHARLAHVLRERRPDDLAALAHHFARSGTAETAAPAVDYSLRAAELAERRYAYDTAVELIQQAIEAYALVPTGPDERARTTVGLYGRLMRAQIRAGAIVAARDTRRRAVETAERTERDELVATAFAAWSEPTPWQSRPLGYFDPATVDTLDRLTARTDLDRVTLARLLQTLVDELNGRDGVDGARVTQAAERQLAVARAAGDPLLLASALATMAKPTPHEFQAARREPLVAELRTLTDAHDLPAYRWACEHAAGMVAGARNDAAGVRRHAEEGLTLARRYRMVEAEAANLSALAMLAHVEGRFEAADVAYADVRRRLRGTGSPQGDYMYALGLITIRLSQGRLAEIEPLLWALYDISIPGIGHTLGLVLALQGKTDQARAISYGSPSPLPDHLYGLDLSIRAQLAYLLRDRAAAVQLARLLLPISDQLAGAASTCYVLRPLAHPLGELYRLLGDEPAALRQFARAEAVARQWGSAHLAAAARTAATTGR